MKQPMTGGKKSVAKANGSNKPMRQVETSMSKKYKGTPKVSFKTIDDIKKMGMTAALKKAGTTKNPEYLEGIRRMYGAKRLAAAQGGAAKPAAKRAFSPAQKSAMGMGAGAGAAKKSASATPKKSTSSAPRNSRLSIYQEALQTRARQSSANKKKSTLGQTQQALQDKAKNKSTSKKKSSVSEYQKAMQGR